MRRFQTITTLALLLPALLLFAGHFALARDFVPVPEFNKYQVPATQHPAPEPPSSEYVNVAFLAGALVLSSVLALKFRSRRGLYVLAIVSLLLFGFVREGCICPIGAIQNVTLAMCDVSYAIPWTVVAILALPLLFTLFFGRTFCASVCPLGALQEIAAVRPVKVPRWIDQSLGLLAFVYLGVAVALAATGAGFLICRYDPFVGFFRRSASVEMLVLGGCFLVVGIFIGRPYCRYLCPLGAVLGLLSKVSGRHVRIPPEECINCRLCEDVCPYGAIEEPTVAPAERTRQVGRLRLALMLLMLPLLIGFGGVLGRWLDVPLSKLHPRVRLAERIRAEELVPPLQGTQQPSKTEKPVDSTEKSMIDAVEHFHNTGGKPVELYEEAIALRKRFAIAGMWLGAWIGLVIGVKLIALSTRRRRANYQPDAAKCVSCGRCFWYCPEEQERLGLIRPGELPVVQEGCSLSSK